MPSPERPVLAPGLYERLITRALADDLDLLAGDGTTLVQRRPIDAAEAADTLARHVEALVERALAGLPEDQRRTRQADLVNRVVALLASDRRHEARWLSPTESPSSLGSGLVTPAD